MAPRQEKESAGGGWGDQADFDRALESRTLTKTHFKAREGDTHEGG